MKGKKYILLKAKIPVWFKWWWYKKGELISLKNLFLGYSRQNTTTGANKLPFTERTLQSTSGVLYECNSIGQAKITGLSTRGTDLSYNTVNNLGILEAGTYTLKVIGRYENLYFKTTLSNDVIQLNSDNEYTFTINEDITDFRVLLVVQPNLTFDVDLYITIAKGIVATTERYTGGIPTPNPNYPIDIENLIGNIPIQAGNKVITFPLSEGQKMYVGSSLTDNGIKHIRKQIVLDGTEEMTAENVVNNNAGFRYNIPVMATNTTDDIIVISNYFLGQRPSDIIGDGKQGVSSLRTEGSHGVYFRVPTDVCATVYQFKALLAELYNNNTPVILEYDVTASETVSYTDAQLQAYTNLCKYFEENTDLDNYIVGG